MKQLKCESADLRGIEWFLKQGFKTKIYFTHHFSTLFPVIRLPKSLKIKLKQFIRTMLHHKHGILIVFSITWSKTFLHLPSFTWTTQVIKLRQIWFHILIAIRLAELMQLTTISKAALGASLESFSIQPYNTVQAKESASKAIEYWYK